MNDTQILIQWFWSEFNKDWMNDDGLCQCGTERLIEMCDRPEKMRAFLLLSVFVDQMMFTHFNSLDSISDKYWYNSIYDEFRQQFFFPKLYAHAGAGMASPSWLVYPNHGYDKKMNWSTALPLANAIMGDLFEWLNRYPNGKELIKKFRTLMVMEIKYEFNPEEANKLLELFSRVTVFKDF